MIDYHVGDTVKTVQPLHRRGTVIIKKGTIGTVISEGQWRTFIFVSFPEWEDPLCADKGAVKKVADYVKLH